MVSLFNKIQSKTKLYLDNKYLEEIYVILSALICILFWKFNSIIGISLLIGIIIVMIILTNDLKYIIPPLTYIIFTIGGGLSSTSVPYSLIIETSILLIVLFVYTFFNGIHLDKIKSSIPILGVGIFTLIPLIWFKPEQGTSINFYLLYFCNLLYALIYLALVNGIKTDSKEILCKTFSYLVVILSLQAMISFYKHGFSLDRIGATFYHVGWGLCNEVGIMILFSLPFSFYFLFKCETVLSFIFRVLFVYIGLGGIFYTASRASYLFAPVIFIVSFILLFIFGKKKNIYLIHGIIFLVIIAFIFILFYKNIFDLIDKIKRLVFASGLDDNNRFELYEQGFKIFTSSFRNVVLGAGFCVSMEWLQTGNGMELVEVVFHSSLVESLVVCGVIGTIFLILHVIQKYALLFKTDKNLAIPLSVGFILVDAYGMMDNTYHMYYYMIPLMIVMACLKPNIKKIDSLIEGKENDI